MKTKLESVAALKALRGFIGTSQLRALGDAMRGEEKQYFFDKVVEVAERVGVMPRTYEQDGLGDGAIAHLHYFKGGADWHITEKDVGTPDEPGQHQAFGLANLGHGAELGYISIVELIENNVELDLHWAPKTLAEIRKGKS